MTVISLHNTDPITYLANADYPLVSTISGDWIVCGNIVGETLIAGWNVSFEQSLTKIDDSRFTYVRMVENGGVMYLNNTLLVRFIYPDILDLDNILGKTLAAIVSTLYNNGYDAYGKEEYVYLGDNKVAGVSCSHMNGKTTAHLFINRSAIPSDVGSFFKYKQVKAVSYVNITYDNLLAGLISGVHTTVTSDIPTSDLKKVNSSSDWVFGGVRDDIRPG